MGGDRAAEAHAEPVDGRTRARERRREQVFSAALALFGERGFDATTMDDIAERAGVARASVFNYFPRKTLILQAWEERQRARALEAVGDVAAADLAGAPDALDALLHRYVIALADAMTQDRPLTRQLMAALLASVNVMNRPALAVDITSILDRGASAGVLPQSADTLVGGLLLAAGYFAALAAWIAVEPEPFPLQTQLLKGADIVLAGLRASR